MNVPPSPETPASLEGHARVLGFVPNSMRVLAYRPGLLDAFDDMVSETFGGSLPPTTAELVFHVASRAAGCRYCQAHSIAAYVGFGGDESKAQFVWSFEECPLFSEAERAALRLARDAALVPNATTSEHFRELRRHYSDAEIVELLAVIALAGWLNRWNDTLATELEDAPLATATRLLGMSGWEPGKHAPAGC